MLDIGWSELLVIGIVALLVVGPKELPGLLRTIGQYVGIIRRQANEFRRQFDEAIKDTELDEIRKEVDSIRTGTQSAMRDVESAARIDPDREMNKSSTPTSAAAATAATAWADQAGEPSLAARAALAAKRPDQPVAAVETSAAPAQSATYGEPGAKPSPPAAQVADGEKAETSA